MYLDPQPGLPEPEPPFLSGAGAGICLELEPEPETEISKMGGSGNPDHSTGFIVCFFLLEI